MEFRRNRRSLKFTSRYRVLGTARVAPASLRGVIVHIGTVPGHQGDIWSKVWILDLLHLEQDLAPYGQKCVRVVHPQGHVLE